MKKIVSLFLSIVLIISVLAGCGNGDAARTAKDFTKYMKNKGFTVEDLTKNTETDGLATSVTVAFNDSFQVEFYELKDIETAKQVFQRNKDAFNEEVLNRSLAEELTTENSDFYAFDAEYKFYLISRKGNTMVYSVVNKGFKDKVKELVKSFGY